MSAKSSVGMPQMLLLEQFGRVLYDTFGEVPYHVGSSVNQPLWRDVDVRVMLSDERWAELGLGEIGKRNAVWNGFTLAFSALGKAMTGLPIDFQLQTVRDANERYDGTRFALGVRSSVRDYGYRPRVEAHDNLMQDANANRADAQAGA